MQLVLVDITHQKQVVVSHTICCHRKLSGSLPAPDTFAYLLITLFINYMRLFFFSERIRPDQIIVRDEYFAGKIRGDIIINNRNSRIFIHHLMRRWRTRDKQNGINRQKKRMEIDFFITLNFNCWLATNILLFSMDHPIAVMYELIVFFRPYCNKRMNTHWSKSKQPGIYFAFLSHLFQITLACNIF